jgi:hypothetical protein
MGTPSRGSSLPQEGDGKNGVTEGSLHSAGTSVQQGRLRGIAHKVFAFLFCGALAFLLYSASQLPRVVTLGFGVPFLLIALEALPVAFVFRWLLGRGSLAWRVLSIIFFSSLIGFSLSQFFFSIREQSRDMPQMFALWGTVAVSLLMIGLALQGRGYSGATRLNEERPRQDILIALGLFVLALGLRLLGPVTGAADEILIFGEMINLFRFPAEEFWDTSTTSNPYFVHWLVYLLWGAIKDSIDAFPLDKFITTFFASLSIPIWFFAVKYLCNRRIALTAALLLAVFGWHWVNSRFLYVYPYEFAVISSATLFSVLAFGRGNFVAAVALGLLWTFAILAKKISIMILPFTGYLFLDFLLVRPTVSRKRVLAAFAAVVAVVIVSYLPFYYADGALSGPAGGTDRFFRYNQAQEARQMSLQALGFTPTGAYIHVFKDAIRQFFVESSDAFRHYFRPAGPLLDPVLAVVGVLGFAYAVLLSFWKRECRVALVGLFVFVLPMVMSFPLDSQEMHGVSRRMMGSTFFIVLLGALGTDLLSAPLVCVASAGFNLYYYKTEYLTQRTAVWFTDHGLRRAALVMAARNAAREGAAVLVFEHPTYEARDAIQDLPDIRYVPSRPELRTALLQIKSGKVAVIIPGDADEYGFPVDDVTKEFADIIPPMSWVAGPKSPRGYPLIITASFERKG